MLPIQWNFLSNQPSNSTSCSDNVLRLLVLVVDKLLWGLQVTLRFEGLLWERYILKGQIAFEGHWRPPSWTLIVCRPTPLNTYLWHKEWPRQNPNSEVAFSHLPDALQHSIEIRPQWHPPMRIHHVSWPPLKFGSSHSVSYYLLNFIG